jgi:hypothetical protein
VRKAFKGGDRVNVRYGFNVFNLTNTTSMDVPQNRVQIAQHGDRSTFATTASTSSYDCANSYEKYGMVVTDLTDQSSSTQDLDRPAVEARV